MKPTLAEVWLWGRLIGAVSLEPGARHAWFQYDPEFAGSGIEVAPLTMPLRSASYSFPELDPVTFKGLPGLLVDSLPDRYGNSLIDLWLSTLGRTPDSCDGVERLRYVARRGMGALEFGPRVGPPLDHGSEIEIGALVDLTSEVLADPERVAKKVSHGEQALHDILSVGTSAGGARPKAVIAWNPLNDAVRSGQVAADPGFEHWLLKLDGVADASRESGVTQGYGAVEFVYSEMARAAGIALPATRLLEEGGRRHFMAKRFDRTAEGDKLHMQSLGALAHLDFNQARANSYEQALLAIRQLGLGMASIEEQFRRMVFNVVARNQDDHVKNIAFLMDRQGRWSLSPAFDVTWAYAPGRPWTGEHQMSIGGKRDDFTVADLRAYAKTAAMARGRSDEILEQVVAAVRRWPRLAERAGIGEARIARIGDSHRLALPLGRGRAA
jgi:serine/threonine-protein kinase HipA